MALCLQLIIIVSINVAIGNAASTPFSNSLHLQASPASVYPGMAGSVTLNCSFPQGSGSGSEFSTLMSLILSRSDNVGNNVLKVYKELATVTSSDPTNVQVKDSLGGVVTGQLLDTTSSYITMKWTSVDQQKVPGSYKCEAYGMDATGHPRVTVAGADITLDSLSTEDLVHSVAARQSSQDQTIAIMQRTIADLSRRLTAQTTCQPNMADRLKASMAAMEEATSEPHRGRYYFLSRLTPLSHPEFQSYCNLYGGYLAEINDQDEFDFVQNFTKTFSGSNEFNALGGTDQGHEQGWTLLTSGKPMNYTNWYPSEPDKSTAQNCLYLWGTYRWQMANWVCEELRFARYICEIPIVDPACRAVV